MKRNGFTLVEILAAIVILSGIMILAVFSGQGIQKNARERTYKEKINSLEAAAALWGQNNPGLVNEVAKCPKPENFDDKLFEYKCYLELSVQKLVDEKYLKADNEDGKVVNPKEKNNFLNNKQVIVYFYYGNYYGKFTDKELATNASTYK